MTVLGWGEVPAADWAALKTKPGADRVPVGDYEVRAEQYKHFEQKDGGVGAHVVVCKVTERNADPVAVGKELHCRFNYDLNPSNEGRRTMNLISQQALKQLFEATQTEAVTTASGNIDPVATVKVVPVKRPTFVLLVTEKDGSEYQETKNFRPSPA